MARPERSSTPVDLAGARRSRLHPEAADRREIITLAIYFLAIVLVTDAVNLRLGIELMTAAVFVAAVAISRRPAQFLRDWWFLLIGLLMWHLSGPIAAFSPFPLHLDFMLQTDRFLFLGRDPVVVVQHALAPATGTSPLDYVTGFIYNLHVPEPYIAAYMLWRINRTVYVQFVAASLALLVLGFVSFVLFPAVPPWMAHGRYHRIPQVLNRFGLVLHAYPLPFHGTPIFSIFTFRGDAVAAFPSEHAAFPLLESLAFFCVNRKAGAVLLVWVLAVLFTILYLGEHWVTDALAGYAYALVIFGAVRLLSRPNPERT